MLGKFKFDVGDFPVARTSTSARRDFADARLICSGMKSA
jgi:hypothetical protein